MRVRLTFNGLFSRWFSEHGKLTEFLLIFVVTLIAGILLFYYEELHEWLTTKTVAEQVMELNSSDAPLKVTLWIDEADKTKFNQDERVTFYYQVNGVLNTVPLYLTLINVTPIGHVKPMLENEPIKVGETYTIPKQSSAFKTTDRRMIFDTGGHEYFKAIVTSESISWEKFLEKIQQQVQPSGLWGVGELNVTIK